VVPLGGSLEAQISFAIAKEPYKRDDILKKRLIFSRNLLIVATPYGVAMISRLLEVIGLFFTILSFL